MSETTNTLSDALFAQLQDEKVVLLHTIDSESSSPTSSAISWVYAVSNEKLRFSVDARSRLITNMKANDRVSVTLFAAGTVSAIYGNAIEVTDSLEGVPFKLACFDIEINDVKDAMFYGARISVEPEYEKTYDKRAAEKLDDQVFSAMKKA
jgi:hypothetical protein